ncbi:c-type cytochrome [Chelatococcus sp. GCM10030263]|uniref:c-type cytochrome n=1 Tax=Chelatococcus sp. GCM10030263 TaxID=3273387 RepID=UPI0036093340
MKIAAGFALALLIGLGVMAVVAVTGVYNVAATSPHLPITRWLLEVGLERSVAFHARNIEVPALDDPAMIEQGMRHFQGGCVSCHGEPGREDPQFGLRLLPIAPPLSQKVPEWSPAELFWIVKHGIKMTGMPHWEAEQRDDEVWAVVAFLLTLPNLNPEAYRALTAVDGGGFEAAEDGTKGGGELIVAAGPFAGSPLACIRCHGADGRGSATGAFPRLTGQDAGYLDKALRDYASGLRPSGIMSPIARALTGEQIHAVSAYYAARQDEAKAPAAARNMDDMSLLQKGGALAAVGSPERGIEACSACHGAGKAGIPYLAGQFEGYVRQQLLLWKAGVRGDPTGVMAPIAQRLTEEEIEALAHYFARLPPSRRGG